VTLAQQAEAFAGEGGLRLTKHNWTRDLAHARYQAFTRANVEAGWQDSGLYPFNRNKVAPYPPVTAAKATPVCPPSLLAVCCLLVATPPHSITVDACKSIWQQGITLSQEGQAKVMHLAQGWETAQAEMALQRREVASAK
jgi:hypothetical protein